MRSVYRSFAHSPRLTTHRSPRFISSHPLLLLSLVLIAALLAAAVAGPIRGTLAGASTSNFGIGQEFDTGQTPRGVAVGDLNADGMMDLVSVDNQSSTVSVRLNTTTAGAGNGTPQFANRQSFTTGDLPESVALGDLNGDGFPEIVVANSVDSTVSVMRNTTLPGGSIANFASQDTYATGAGPTRVILADLNGDGLLDLAVANSNDDTVSVLLNTSAPGSVTTFSTQQSFAVGLHPGSLVAVDLNGDGKLDLVTANSPDNNISVLLNITAPGAASPSFAVAQNVPIGDIPATIATGDLNGDGLTDLAVTNFGSDSVSVLLNTTAPGDVTATFAEQDIAFAGGPTGITMGDVNGDGRLDLAVTTPNAPNANKVLVALNTTTPGAATPSFATTQAYDTGISPVAVVLSDLNGDGKLDLIVANEGTSVLTVLQNRVDVDPATPGFTAAQNFTTGSGASSVRTGDLNGDGRLDLVVTDQNINTVSVLLNTTGPGAASPSYATQQIFAVGSGPTGLALGDLNGDGRLDLIATNQLHTTVSILLSTTAPGSSIASFTTEAKFNVGSLPSSVTPGDVNGDGLLDLVVTNSQSNNLSVLLNTTAPGATTPSFVAAQNFAVGSGPVAVALGDLNGDGRLDLVVTNLGNSTVTIRLNTTTPGSSLVALSSSQNFATGSSPAAVALGDLNGDGRLDLAVANQDSDTASVLLNTTAPGSSIPSFAAQQAFATGPSPTSVTLGDLNGDGKFDLAVANKNSNSVSVLRNTTVAGAIVPSFAAQQDFGTSFFPLSVALADMNGDGKLDLAVANSSGNNVSVLLNAPVIVVGTDLSRELASGSSNSQIATVTDFGGDGNVIVTVSSANPDHGVTISNIVNTGGVITADIVADCPGSDATFTLQANDGSSTVSDTLNVTVTAAPTPTVTADGPTTFCAGGSVTLTSSSATGNQWYLGSNPVTGAINQTYVATASGDYKTVANSCTDSPSLATTVTVNPIPATPTITPGGPTTFCEGGSVTLTSSSASGNQWLLNGNPIGGATNQTYAPTASGNYTVTDTATGCTSAPSAATTVTVNPIPAKPTISPLGPATLCPSGSVLLTSSSATGNQWTLNGNPIGGASSQTYSATAAGNYAVTVTTSGCSSAAATATTVTANVAPTLTYATPQTVAFDDSTTVNAASSSGAITGYAVLSVVPAMTTTPTVNASGVVSITDAQPGGAHVITVRATDGCSVTADASFTLDVTLVTTYADRSGNCGAGNTPCYTGMQAAIDALTGPGTVNVTGGTFAEDVNVTGNATVNIDGDTTVNSLTLSGGTLNGSNGGSFTLTLASGDWNNEDGTFNPGTGAVSFTGTGQSIGGANPTTFNNLTIGAGGTTANSTTGKNARLIRTNGAAVSLVDETVTGVLTLNGDLTITDPAKLIMPASASSTGAGDVIGNLERTGFVSNVCPLAPCLNTLSLGNPDNQITVTGGGAPASILVKLTKAAPPAFGSAVQRHYAITESGGSGFTVTLRLHYLDTELNGNTPEANLNLRRFNGAGWVPMAPTRPVNSNDNWVENDAVTGFSTWTFSTFSPTSSEGAIVGRITDVNGAPVAGTVIELSGAQTRKVITDSNGQYLFDNVTTGDFYTVTPLRANYNFNPVNRSFSQTGNLTENVFTAESLGDNANPLDTAEYFVRQQYLDILGREPDESGFNYWSNQLLACGADASCTRAQRAGTAAAFFIEPEAQQTGAYIYDSYAGVLGRRPAFAEYTADRAQVVGGATLDTAKIAFAQSFVQRAEVTARYPVGMTAETFVDALIQSAAAAGGNLSNLNDDRANLIGLYHQAGDQVASRAAVIRSLADNAAFKQTQYNQAFVLTEYFSYLKRDVDPNGFAFWVGVLNTGDPDNYRGMVCSFTTSAEYQNRFSRIVSHSNGECSGQ